MNINECIDKNEAETLWSIVLFQACCLIFLASLSFSVLSPAGLVELMAVQEAEEVQEVEIALAVEAALTVDVVQEVWLSTPRAEQFF